MAQLSDATIRAIVLRMLLLTAMAPWQADRGSLELSIDACFVKIGQGDHLLRLLCGLWSCFSTCSVHCQSWKRRFLDSTASVLYREVSLVSAVISGLVRFAFALADVGRKCERQSVVACVHGMAGRRRRLRSPERSALALEFPIVSFWQRSTRLTSLQRCLRTVHRDYLWAMVWVPLELAKLIKDAQGFSWRAMVHVCHGSQRLGSSGLFQSVYCNVDRLLLLLLFYLFHSLDFGVFTRFLDVTIVVKRVSALWPR